MKAELSERTLTCFPEGHVDSVTAPQFEADIESERQANPHEKLVLDMEGLEYISSAGLRVLLRLKRNEPELLLTNVRADVYDVLEMTGFTQMMEVQKAFKTMSVEGAEIIGKGAKGTVYRYNPEIVVKVYNRPDSLADIQRERENARRAFVLGIPTAISFDIVKVDGKYASVFELLACDSFTDLIRKNPDDMASVAREFALLLRKIHETKVSPSDFPDERIRVKKWLREASLFLGDENREKYEKLIGKLPEVDTLLHGDYHTNNVMMQNGEALLIDMDTLSHGAPVIEMANVYVTYVGFGLVDPSVVANFLGIPYEKAVEFWNLMLPIYLGTEDREKIRKALDKIETLGLLRVIRHVVHRGNGSQNDWKLIETARNMIAERIDRIDTFEL